MKLKILLINPWIYDFAAARLPGQDFGEVRAGVGWLKSLDASIHLAEFSPIPGTQARNDLLEGGIVTKDLDPLLTNNTVFSFSMRDMTAKRLRRSDRR
jgi:hypothetical protein